MTTPRQDLAPCTTYAMAPPPPPPHVAMVPFPFGSHANTLLPLARALAAVAPAGTTISFLTTAGNIVQHRKAGAFPGNLRFVEVQDGMPSGGAGETPPLRRIEIFMAAAAAGGLREGLEAARDAAGGARVTCVVGNAFMCFAEEAAAAAGAPWVPVWTGSPCALLALLRTDALREDVGDHAASRADDLLTSHPGLYRYRVRDLPNSILCGDLKHVMSPIVQRMAQRLPRAGIIVPLNTIPGVDPPDVTAALGDELPNGLPFGPYHLLPAANSLDTDPYDCLAWLDRHPVSTVVYISFGTIFSPQPDELLELVAGLEASGAPFLWSLREGSWPLLPPGFLERAAAGTGLVVPWVPQVGVLRHASVGAFVTHAGWGSVLQSVSSGVPMACRPMFADQMMNARTVASIWGNGMMFEGLMTRGEVAHAVVMLLRGEEGKRVRARAQELQVLVAKAFEPEGGCRKNFDKFVSIVCGV